MLDVMFLHVCFVEGAAIPIQEVRLGLPLLTFGLQLVQFDVAASPELGYFEFLHGCLILVISPLDRLFAHLVLPSQGFCG